MDRSTQLALLHEQARACSLCLDEGYSIIPGAVMSGRIGAQVLTIGQAPGPTEVVAKRPFNAGSGRRLFQWLGEAGFDEAEFRATQYMSSVTKCYPGKHAGGKGDRVPSKAEQALCRPFLLREIELIQPRVIIPIGGLAIKLFYPAKMRLRDLIGAGHYVSAENWDTAAPFSLKKSERVTQFVEGADDGVYIVPLPHPSGASLWPNKAENKALIAQAITLLATIRQQWGL